MKTIYLTFFLALAAVICSYAQAPDTTQTDKDDNPFIAVERMPEFPGGIQAMHQFITDHVKYPKRARAANIEGRVFVSFVVGSDGHIRDVQIAKGIGYGCDEECVRVIKSMPRWTPGRQSGRDVAVRYSVPISFTFRKERKT